MNMQGVWEIVKGKRIIGMEITGVSAKQYSHFYGEPTDITFRLDDGSSLVVGTEEVGRDEDYEAGLSIQAFAPVKADGKTVWKMEYYE